MGDEAHLQPSDQPGTLLTLENGYCRVAVAPRIGGRLTSMVYRHDGREDELLWRNQDVPLRQCQPGTVFDPEFFGGIDELLPSDLPETIDGVLSSDHGELWTTALQAAQHEGTIILSGMLPACGLAYQRRMRLGTDRAELICDYRITNPGNSPRRFMWKLHAALAAEPGDRIDCPAGQAQPADPAYTTCPDLRAFRWPWCSGVDKSLVREADGSCEFLALLDLRAGRMGWHSPGRDVSFTYLFDPAVFPCAWIFQSFGGLAGHFTTVLEPCTCLHLSVNDAIDPGACSVLDAGSSLSTTVRIILGRASGPLPDS